MSFPVIESKPTGPLFAEYIWIDASQAVRSKTKVLWDALQGVRYELAPSTFPVWGFDGSSTGQAEGQSSDCVLQPVRVFRDPLRGRGHFLVLCEVLDADHIPHATNSRAKLRAVLEDGDLGEAKDCWFGLEQEHTLFKGSSPLGFGNERRFPAPQGPYYCGVGADEVRGRALVEEHLLHCTRAGILVSGINAEVMPGQWEFQIGPLAPLAVGDHLWVARWLLYRLGEKHGIHATLDPKPVPGDWNGAGMHCNFSTPEMRLPLDHHPKDTGTRAIEAWCEKASTRISDHLAAYGEGIEMRLTGKHETCRWDEFRWGAGDRTASVRIPLETSRQGHGYLEDRRPNANACPYEVAAVMMKTAYDLW
jgi:glutamine synthetase